MVEDMTYSFCGSAEYMAPEMLLKYTYFYKEKVMVSRSTIIVLEHSSMSSYLASLHITRGIRPNFLTTF